MCLPENYVYNKINLFECHLCYLQCVSTADSTAAERAGNKKIENSLLLNNGRKSRE